MVFIFFFFPYNMLLYKIPAANLKENTYKGQGKCVGVWGVLTPRAAARKTRKVTMLLGGGGAGGEALRNR